MTKPEKKEPVPTDGEQPGSISGQQPNPTSDEQLGPYDEEQLDGQSVCIKTPSRKDKDYGKSVCCTGPSGVCFDNSSDNYVKNQNALKQDVITCKKLMCEWSDSEQVIMDCESYLKSATDELNKQSGGDLPLAYGKLMQVRRRLVQAWESEHSKCWIKGLLVWQLALLGACAFLIVYFRLLPGQTPRVSSSHLDAAILFSSAVFGAVGGLFDGLSFMSKQYGNRQFDKGQWLWYVTNSILGAILGVVVFGTILAGLITTTGNGISGQNTSATTSTPSVATVAPASSDATATPTIEVVSPTPAETVVASPTTEVTSTPTSTDNSANSNSATDKVTMRAAFVLVLAFIAGVKQCTVVKFLERIADSIFGGGDKGADKPKSS